MERKKKKNPSSKSKDECMKKKQKKSKIVVSKSEVYQHISEDLIIEILLRLPTTSVVRFKQVCKTWYSLITNPDFLRTHYSSSLQFYKHTSTTDDEELMVSTYLLKRVGLKYQNKEHPLLKQGVFPSELLDYELINSCNGLLLLKSNNSSYYVCNPLIKHLLKIPSISHTENIKYWGFIFPYILFDPSTSLSYKLIRRCMDENGDIFFSVYSSEIGSWRRLISFPSESINDETAVLLNGIFYWKEYNGDHLLCFDLKKENVWFLPLPPKPIGYRVRRCFYFGECDERLRLIEKCFVSFIESESHLTIPCSFDIMETEPQQQQQQQQQDCNPTWSVKYHVNINTGYVQYHPASTFRIIQFYKTKKNEGEQEALLLNIQGRIIPFNLKNNTFGKELRIQNRFIFTAYYDFSDVFPYITTTLLPLL